MVGNIIEVGVEEAIDQLDGTIGSDVRTKVKISQKKNKMKNLKDEGEESGKSLDTVARPIRNCMPNRNCAVRVIVTAPKFIPKLIIEKAAQKLKDTPSFGAIFRTSKKGFQIRKKKDNKYVVTIKFKDRFLELFR